ncbi:MAG: SDR family oxidoreductase [Pirellulales bacterium]|nr:SDR family oxidoreductase [Pirellulales bacterium]
MSDEYLKQLFGLDGQVAVVVGGTGVLGGALSEGLAQAGAHVVVAGRSLERGEARVAAIKNQGGDASFFAVDATSRESIEQLRDTVLAEHGRVQALVNAAGINSATPYLEITDEEFQQILSANLTTMHMACQAFVPHMAKAGGGAILNIGSVTSSLPLSKVFTYAATKAAVLSLTQNVAREFAPQNVRVNCLCPGFFPAEQNRKILTPDRVADIMRHTPMDRFGSPEELVGAALLLLSASAGSFITGTALYVDGGFTSMTI